jgi:transcriptional regulator with GAF, ATPase, and Fis domain/tetratricopeptide (TPR) repeat protein
MRTPPLSEELANRPPGTAWRLLERVGEGATSVVWRARHEGTGRHAALKVARASAGCADAVLREASVLALVERRWGPALLDAAPGCLATEWIDGSPVDAAAIAGGREAVAAVVAHAVGRALEELHQAGVQHGDVKPANILLGARFPQRDAANDRGATLIDLSLGGDMRAPALGATARYAAPELYDRAESGPAADLWALGITLAEILDVRVAQAADPREAIANWGPSGDNDLARWIQVLVSPSPGGRPSAAWLATSAARWLALAPDDEEAARGRGERVRRAYLRERAREIVVGAVISPEIGQPARDWLERAIDWARKLDGTAAAAQATPAVVEPLTAVRRARWLVSLVGPSAAAWPIGFDGAGEGDLAARAMELARARQPASWTLEDLLGRGPIHAGAWHAQRNGDLVLRLVRELARPSPDARALALAEDEVARGEAPATLIAQVALALARAGETGRAWVALAGARAPELDALRAEVARRRGDREAATSAAHRAMACGDGADCWSGQATLARLAWDDGDLDVAERALEGARGVAAGEVRALIEWRRGGHDRGLAAVEQALAQSPEPEAQARLEGTRGLLELSRGASERALHAFGRAVELATRAGAVVDEATYLTSEAAAASDAGELSKALASATRAALLWERLGRPQQAARAWLARAAALATMGAAHATDEAAEEARARAKEAGDRRAATYARWAQVEVRAPGDDNARAWAIESAEGLKGTEPEDQLRAAARLLVWAPDAVDERAVSTNDKLAPDMGAAARWEWWGARARAALAGRHEAGGAVVAALLTLVDVPAPLSSRGPALEAAARLAMQRGDGEAARRFDLARIAAARTMRETAPTEFRSSLASVSWANASALEAGGDVAFAPAQVAQLEAIVRALSGRDRLRPLLEQVLDTMVIWTGVERGLLLLRAPDGRLVARAARNLARDDLVGDQLALSQTIARRAIETGDAVVATDALSTLGDVHASVHALRLRSVLAVPLLARGETLGVVYLDDRVRKGAFGPRELAWVRVVASQAAMAVADARDAVLLRRAARRAERARLRLEAILSEREVELDVTRTELERVRGARATRYRYDEIVGRSEPMRELLHLVDRVTASDVPVLVVGESGTGKELVARAMHDNGSRTRRPFVSENCANVPETLLETTLFGHVRGAFTGASSTRAGLFDVADGGTLFLDEIGEMSIAMQSKLLRVLQDGEVRPVGGERVRKVNVRIIGATHRDLAALVASGSFREDLLYRLNVVTLHVPALRERAEDIPLLVEHLVRKHSPDRPVKVTRAAMTKLTHFSWPGNVRQLENEVRRALVLGDGGIDVTDLSGDVRRGVASGAHGGGLDLRSRVDALEAELVQEALGKAHGNQTRAAKLLGLSRFGLQKMMKRLGVKIP